MKPLLILALCLTACGQPSKVYRCTDEQFEKVKRQTEFCVKGIDTAWHYKCFQDAKSELCDTLPTVGSGK